ncbi:MAG TPA: SagB/ThcOx family dehydrogenase [Syntrophorhabdaceae bacterium]|nr:SagB/ThcOx family dehydrogenase [Syntrophorhabdaceae bacterium]
MKKYMLMTAILIVSVCMLVPLFMGVTQVYAQDKGAANIKLPAPRYSSDTSVEKALAERRSVRSYKAEPLTMAEIGQILWAAQGITEPKKGLRTAPSPRGAFLIDVYLFAGNVTGLANGMYRYVPQGHELMKIAEGNLKDDLLYKAAPQAQIKFAPAVLLIAGKSTGEAMNPYWTYLEAGHVSENVYLQAESLKLGTVTMAGFKADDVKNAVKLPANEQPIYLMSIGKK